MCGLSFSDSILVSKCHC